MPPPYPAYYGMPAPPPSNYGAPENSVGPTIASPPFYGSLTNHETTLPENGLSSPSSPVTTMTMTHSFIEVEPKVSDVTTIKPNEHTNTIS